MDAAVLRQVLPPYKAKMLLISPRQSVNEIIKEVLAAHRNFSGDYDLIAPYFNKSSLNDTLEALHKFCRLNITYNEEGDGRQTTKSPAGMLATGTGDCKHYSSFIGGVLDAINRLYGKNINWVYRFASYIPGEKNPSHVFIVVKDGNKDLWVDPTPGAAAYSPRWWIDKKISAQNKIGKMALYRLSGVNVGGWGDDVVPGPFLVNDLLDQTDHNLTPELFQSIQLLLKHGVLDANANMHNDKLLSLQKTLDPATFQQVAQARQTIQGAVVGSWFGDAWRTIWRGVKKVVLLTPRAAYLSLVAVNAFGYATKLKNCLWNKDGSYDENAKAKIKKIWQDRFGGDWSKLENTILNGATHKAILGAGPAAAALPAWVAIASALIAALSPIITGILQSKQSAGQLAYDYNIDPMTGLPYGSNPPGAAGGVGGIMDFIEENPLIIVGGAAVAVYLYQKSKKK